MTTWPDVRILQLFGIQLPILQAPMAGSTGSEMAIAVSEAGGLGSLPCAVLSIDQMRAELATIRGRTSRPINLNFFCHVEPPVDPEREAAWQRRAEVHHVELGIDPRAIGPAPNRAPFDAKACAIVEEFRPEVVSFHFGFPSEELLARVKHAGAKIVSSATTVTEARWLEAHGCDAIVAQGFEAGGHRGMFLDERVETQVGTFALVPQIVDAVKVPVIAAGAIADARGIAAAFALGASAVQIGTAYLFCPEAKISSAHRAALRSTRDDESVITNVFTGRPARGIVNRWIREVGPMAKDAPAFPRAAAAVAPLRAAAEAKGSGEFSPLWSGQAARLSRELPAGELTRVLAAETLERLTLLRP
ncbi:MAG: NAD(P)H-dependent flavin oxidoreductase [Polyangiales bacterium]